jgi:hypothetical protein
MTIRNNHNGYWMILKHALTISLLLEYDCGREKNKSYVDNVSKI